MNKQSNGWQAAVKCALANTITNAPEESNSASQLPDEIRKPLIDYIQLKSACTVESAEKLLNELNISSWQLKFKYTLKSYPIWMILMLCSGIIAMFTTFVAYFAANTWFLFVIFFSVALSVTISAGRALHQAKKIKQARQIWNQGIHNQSADEIRKALDQMSELLS